MKTINCRNRKMKLKLSLGEFLQNSSNEAPHLPNIPSAEDLLLLRKGLRKKEVPDIAMLPNEFGYEGVGHFQKHQTDRSVVFEWMIPGYESSKSVAYLDLCSKKENEKDRLEFGWMIGNFARLDAISHLSQMRPISYEDHHQNLFNKQYAQQKKHFEKIEIEWRHWSIVLAGHMIF